MKRKLIIPVLTSVLFFNVACSQNSDRKVFKRGASKEAAAQEDQPIKLSPEEEQKILQSANVLKKEDDGLYALMETTRGRILLKLEMDKTPVTVGNFVGLAEGKKENTAKNNEPFFDGLTFHRVIADFMIQGGDPAGTGMGGPGYKFMDETRPDLKHDRPGIFSMANSGPATNGSQFFITHVPTPHLDGKHTVFGHVVYGQSVVNSIEQGDKMDHVTILRKGKDAEAFDGVKAFDEGIEKAKSDLAERKRIFELPAEERKANFAERMKKEYPKAKQTESGLMYIIEEKGKGSQPVAGKTVKVHYAGYWLDGTKFDSSFDRGEPIAFPLGQGRVIPGWDEGISLLNVGGKAKLIIPANLAYGERGFPGAIPPYSDLVFEVELVEIPE